MLSLDEVKKLWGDPHITDAEAEEIRAACYELAVIIVEIYIIKTKAPQ